MTAIRGKTAHIQVSASIYYSPD